MRIPGRCTQLPLLVGIFVVSAFAVDGEVSRTEAQDRWVGVATISAEGVVLPMDFTILVNPGVSATWEWRFRGVQLGSGPLAATVSGAQVNGTLFVEGGLMARDPLCCLPCNFSGAMSGNRVDGTFDPATCGGTGTFFIVKQ